MIKKQIALALGAALTFGASAAHSAVYVSTADFSGSGPITVNGVRGLSFRVRATTPCVSCVVFPALRGPISYNSGTFFPFEDQNACL